MAAEERWMSRLHTLMSSESQIGIVVALAERRQDWALLNLDKDQPAATGGCQKVLKRFEKAAWWLAYFNQ